MWRRILLKYWVRGFPWIIIPLVLCIALVQLLLLCVGFELPMPLRLWLLGICLLCICPAVLSSLSLKLRNSELQAEISERLRVDAKLRQAMVDHQHDEALWHAAIDHLPMDIWVLGLDGRCMVENHHAESQWGRNAGRSFEESTYPAGSLKRWRNTLSQSRTGGVASGEIMFTGPRGETHVFEMMIPVLGCSEALQGMVVVHINIDARKAAEAATARLEMQLRQNQKLEAIGTLAGGIAHDFNNILAIIYCNTELAQTAPECPAKLGVYFDAIIDGADRARDLVRQILTFSRKRNAERTMIDVAAGIRDTLGLMRASLPSTIELVLDLAEGLPPIMAESVAIHQILTNLCTNASHAMEGRNGRLQIRLLLVEVDAQMILSAQELHPGPHIKLCVSDNGKGMNKEVMARMFEPFFTTKPPGEGTGLGLAVVHGIVRDHGGSIRVNSAPGQGTTFEILLPAVRNEVRPQLSVEGPFPRGRGQGVLVVDDEPGLVFGVAEQIEKLGYRAFPFSDSRAAFAFFCTQSDRVHAVLTDTTMPRMSGQELAESIWRLSPAAPIIIMSGNITVLDGFMARNVGRLSTMNKPCNSRALAEALHRAVSPREKAPEVRAVA